MRDVVIYPLVLLVIYAVIATTAGVLDANLADGLPEPTVVTGP